ncbi:MAG: MFS transporter [Prevotella sp.]|nr:MFS transporter [Prevotella sp.]MDY6131576.1 MFS transporter [Prevotella sp.]
MNSENSRQTMRARGEALNLSTFFCLYMAQMVPMSFLSTALQVMMRENHFSLSAIALLQLVKLPWILKFLWAPLVDRHCVTIHQYKRFIFSSECVYATALLVVGMLDFTTDIYIVVALVILSLTASATQDIATDSLAVLAFHRQDKSMVNSIQSMGSFGGTLVGGGLLLMVLHHYGWNVVLTCLAAFVLLMLIPLMTNRQISIESKDMKQRARLSDFFWFFTRKSIWRQIAFLVLYYAGLIGILSVLRPYLVDLGYSMKEIGVLSGVVGTGFAFAASFGAGFLVRRIGLYKARILFALLTLFTTVYFVGITYIRPTFPLVCTAVVLLWSSYGVSTMVVFTSSMNSVRPGREGTDFTVQTVITHLSGMFLALSAGRIADIFQYRGLFVVESAVAVISLVYAIFSFRKGEVDYSK